MSCFLEKPATANKITKNNSPNSHKPKNPHAGGLCIAPSRTKNMNPIVTAIAASVDNCAYKPHNR